MRSQSEPTRSKAQAARQRGRWAVLRGTSGAQLVELALSTPLLLVFLVGMSDFGSALDLKQKLTNAAREGARIAASQSRADLTQSTPPSVLALEAAVANYMANAHVTTCVINTTPTATGNFTWAFSSTTTGCTANPIVIIARNVPVTANGTTALCTQVTVKYPFAWSFGHVIGLVAPGARYPGTIWLSTSAIMKNLT